MADFYGFLANWLNDALACKMPANLDKVVIVRQKEGPGPYAEPAAGAFLPERLGGKFTGLSPAQRGPQS